MVTVVMFEVVTCPVTTVTGLVTQWQAEGLGDTGGQEKSMLPILN